MRVRLNSSVLLWPATAVVLAFLLGLPGSVRASAEPAGSLYVEVSAEGVTVRAKAVSIRTLLQELAQHSNLQVVMYVSLDETVTLVCEQQSMPDVIRSILRHRNYALQYVPHRTLPGDAGWSSPNMLWVFSGSAMDGVDTYPDGHLSEVVIVSAAMPAAKDGVDVVERRRAVLKLADSDTDSDQAVVALTTALADADAGVRGEAVDALADIGSPGTLGLLEVALQDMDKAVRETAIEAIAGIGGDAAARALAPLLNDADAGLRIDAVDALGEIGGAVAAELLQQALADDQTDIREVAAGYLATLPNRGP